MFSQAFRGIGDGSIENLLEKLKDNSFIIKDSDLSIVSDNDLAEAWDHYYDDPELAVTYLETMFGFIFERTKQLESSNLGLKDWNRLVRSAKDLLKDNDKKQAKELLAKRFTFLNLFELNKVIEQAAEELEKVS